MKKNIASALLLALSLALLCLAYQRAEQGVIRMHIIAQSDEESDQRTKGQVREALLPMVNAALQETDDPIGALNALLPALEQEAERIAQLPVRAALSRESYPARFDSGSFLPAGRYTALRITLGAGEGHNWWGVVYPQDEEETVEIRWWFLDWWRSLSTLNTQFFMCTSSWLKGTTIFSSSKRC